MFYDLLAYLSDFIINFIESAGYFGVFALMTLESAAVPVPSEVTMPFAGFVASGGGLNFWLIVAAGTLGNLVGSLILFWIGFYGGRPLVEKYGSYVLISRRELEWTDGFFARHGEKVVFFGRLLPIARTYISLPAGLAKMPLGKFITYTTVGSFFWSLFLTYVGWKLGENWRAIEVYFRQADVIIILLIIVAVVWFVWRHIKR